MRSLLSLAVLAAPAAAQNFNLDFQPAGSPMGTAPPSYGAVVPSPGVWNPITSISTSGLVSTAGVASNVALTITTFQPNVYWEVHDFSNPPDEALIDDALRVDWSDCTLAFSGLAPGHYAVYTICVTWLAIVPLQVSVPGSPDPLLYVSGAWNGSYVPGSPQQVSSTGNYARHTLNVTTGALQVDIHASGLADQIMVEGIQLVRLDPDVTPLCPGDGTQAPCPCANSGMTGRGCENSAGTGGGQLGFSGNTVPDTLVLHASGMLPSASCIFLQGTANVAPVVFGDGLRCTGGVLKRLYLKSASGGAADAPGPGDLSITQRSAQLGDPIPIGDRRYYQVYYRDSNLVFCPAPQGSSFNITSSLRVFW